MRIRKPFAAAFTVLALISGYLGLGSIRIPTGPFRQSDKGLHFVTFFLLSLTFYWIFETTRRRALNLTLLVCTVVLGCGSEILQSLVPNGREFDPWDILANILGSLAAVAVCAWYHRRMLERKRASKHYRSISGDVEAGNADEDVELNEGMGPQETGVTASGQPERNLDEELDNWDENAEEDWDGGENMVNGSQVHTSKDGKTGDADKKKRDD